MIVAGLVAYALVVSCLAPRVLSRAWAFQHPGAGLLAWHVVVSTVMVSVVGAAFVASHDIWEPFATLVFRAEPESVHHQYVGTATVNHAWNAAVLLVGILGLRLVVVTITRLSRTAADRRELRSAIQALRRCPRTPPTDDVVVVAFRDPTAFCVPGRAPMIVVSDGALDVLSSEQLAAVVAHERAHLSYRHAAGAAWAVALADSFPRWPLVRAYAATVPKLHEMQADDIAAEATAGHVVASSLLALSGLSTSGSLSIAGGDVRERGLRMLVPLQRRRGISATVAIGIAAVLIVPTLLVAAPGLAVAGSDHHPEFSHGATVPHP